MGNLLDQLNASAEKAKEENKISEKEVEFLEKSLAELEEKIKDFKKDKTSH